MLLEFPQGTKEEMLPCIFDKHQSSSKNYRSTQRAQISDKAAHYLHIAKIHSLESQPSSDAPSPPNIHRQSSYSKHSESANLHHGQITNKIQSLIPVTTPDPSIEFHCKPFILYLVM